MSSGRFIGNPPRKQSILSAESEESHKSGSPVSRRPTAGFTITPDLHTNSGICFSFRVSGRPNRARRGFRFGRPARRRNAASGSQADVFPLLWHRLGRHTKGEDPRPPRQSTSQLSLLSATRKNGRLPLRKSAITFTRSVTRTPLHPDEAIRGRCASPGAVSDGRSVVVADHNTAIP